MGKISMSLTWPFIIAFIVLVNVGVMVSEAIEIPFLGQTVALIILSAVVFVFIRKRQLASTTGLTKINFADAKGSLFYIPLLILVLVNGAFFFDRALSAQEILLIIAFMALVGVLEEIIFRGFLLKAIDDGLITRKAVIIAGAAFGLGHIFSLLMGYEIIQTAIQIVLAALVGIALCLLFARTKSIVPGIIFHFLFNSAATLATAENAPEWYLQIGEGILILVALVYMVYLWKTATFDSVKKGEPA